MFQSDRNLDYNTTFLVIRVYQLLCEERESCLTDGGNIVPLCDGGPLECLIPSSSVQHFGLLLIIVPTPRSSSSLPAFPCRATELLTPEKDHSLLLHTRTHKANHLNLSHNERVEQQQPPNSDR